MLKEQVKGPSSQHIPKNQLINLRKLLILLGVKWLQEFIWEKKRIKRLMQFVKVYKVKAKVLKSLIRRILVHSYRGMPPNSTKLNKPIFQDYYERYDIFGNVYFNISAFNKQFHNAQGIGDFLTKEVKCIGIFVIISIVMCL